MPNSPTDILSIRPLCFNASFEGHSPAVVHAAMRRAAHLMRALGFFIGDALNHEAKHGRSDIMPFANELRMPEKELATMKRVARGVQAGSRRDFGSMEFMRPLALLSEEEQERLFDWAEKNPGMSRAQFAKAIRREEAEDPADSRDQKRRKKLGHNANLLAEGVERMAKSGDLADMTPDQLANLSKSLLPAITAHKAVMGALAKAGDGEAMLSALAAMKAA